MPKVTVEELYNQQTKIEEQLGSALAKSKDWVMRERLLTTIKACSEARAAIVGFGRIYDGLEY